MDKVMILQAHAWHYSRGVDEVEVKREKEGGSTQNKEKQRKEKKRC